MVRSCSSVKLLLRVRLAKQLVPIQVLIGLFRADRHIVT